MKAGDNYMRKLGFFAIFLGLFLFAGRASATTYYIDYASGSDANSGTSKTAPWIHLPGMQGCSSVCSSASPNPGDSFILKGGVTWPNSSFPISWSWSGSSGQPIYIGVDKTWFTGSSWARPIFNAGGTPIAGTYDVFIRAMSTAYQTWDNIEMTGFNWNQNFGYGANSCGVWAGGSGITISNWYVHGWSHTGGASNDGFTCILGDTNAPYMPNSVITTSIFDGSDSTNGGDSGTFTYAWPSETRNVIHDVSNGILPTGHGEVAYNLIYNVRKSFDATDHENAIETLIADGAYYIHDNVIHDIYGECMMVGNTNETDYLWNNVIYEGATGNCNPIHFPQNSDPGISMFFWNNTVAPRPGEGCFYTGSGYGVEWVSVTIQNTHCITTSSTIYSSGVTPSTVALIADHNTLESPTTAAAQGYTPAGTFAYAPAATSGASVGAGVNLAVQAVAGLLSTFTSDTQYACTVNSSKQVVCPARTPKARSTTWDSGAYQFSGSTSAAPMPPTNVTAVPH
jgi:hypothetical protein